MDNTEPNSLEYFAGGVPTTEYFRFTLNDLSSVIDRSSSEQGVNRLNEVCFIGLVSYFEAFCKDHFASILNIEPTLLENLAKENHDVTIDPSQVLGFGNQWRLRIGFLVAEKYDFGTAQKINALYNALLKVTPFSKEDARRYDQILRDRNLLVHHGGTYTLSYLRQAKAPDPRGRAFFDSLVVTAEFFDEQLSFIESIALKIMSGTHTALARYIKDRGLEYSQERSDAVQYLLWWGDGKP